MMNNTLRKKKDNMTYVLFFIILVSNIILRTEEHINLYAVLSAIVTMVVIVRIMLKPKVLSRSVVNGYTVWVILLFTMYFFYGIALPTYDYFSIKYFFFMLVMIIVSTLILIDKDGQLLIDILTKVSAISTLAIFFYTLLMEWQYILQGSTRIGETGSGNVNTLAIYMGVLSVPSLYKIIYNKKFIYAIPYLLTVIIILLSGSKKGLVYILLGMIILSILKNKLKIHRYIPILLLLIGILYIIFYNKYLFEIIGFRIIDFLGTIGLNISGASTSHSTELRLLMNKVGYLAFLEHPIFGGGWFYFSRYSGLGTYSHNNYMEILVTYGINGFILYYSMYLYLMIKLHKLIKSDNRAKLLYTLLILNLINDNASVSFSYNLVNYLILLISFIYAKCMMYHNKKERGMNYAKNNSNN